MQTANRAAIQVGGDLIRKIRPFEESHIFAHYIMRKNSRAMGVSFQKPHRMSFYEMLIGPENSSPDSP